jgi:hypothetical protein
MILNVQCLRTLVQNCSNLILVEKKNPGHFFCLYLELGLVLLPSNPYGLKTIQYYV